MARPEKRPRLMVVRPTVTPVMVDPFRLPPLPVAPGLPPPADPPPPEAPPVPGQPATVKVAGTLAVLSPFWSVSVAAAVPDGVWHVD
ncbi:MAG TPA: hypothetical protein VGN29_15610, partial [Solirubrobacteraceae bacterium]|nr:hypothetical protein [Solirubrobacteraceae bacterium]